MADTAQRLRFPLLLGAIMLLGFGQAAHYAHNMSIENRAVFFDPAELAAGGKNLLKADRQQFYEKAVWLAKHGIWTHHGSHASANAPHVPGSLQTLLSGGPMLLWFSPYAPIVLIQLLHLAAFLLLDSFVRRVFPGSGVRLALAVVFWLNPWRLYANTLWNPAWLPPAAALHLLSAWMLWQPAGQKRVQPAGQKGWQPSGQKGVQPAGQKGLQPATAKSSAARFLWTALHALSIGFAMQVHYSFTLLACLSLYLWWRGLVRPHLGGLLTAVLLVALSLIPWALEVRRDPGLLLGDICESGGKYYLGRGLVEVAPILKALLYWFRYGSSWFISQLLPLGDVGDWIALQAQWGVFGRIAPPQWARALAWLWWGITLLAGAATLLISMQSNWLAFRRSRGALLRRGRAPDSAQQWALLYAMGACMSLLLLAVISPIYFGFWQAVILFPAALLPLLWRCPGWAAAHGRRFGGALLALALFFSLVNLAAAQHSKQYSWQLDLQSQFDKHLAEGDYRPKPREIARHCTRR